MRLAVICTHPIQYYAPVFKLLAKKIELKVFYTAGSTTLFDKGFNQPLNWDIPLLEGYHYEFLTNTSKKPGTHHFTGIKNPDVLKKISDFHPDHLLVYGWANSSHLRILLHFKAKIPILFRGDSTSLHRKSPFRELTKAIFLRYVYRHIDKALYVGLNNKAYFKKYGLREECLIFAPHAIDNHRFAEKSASDIRKVLNLQERDMLVLFAGKFEPIKNPELLLRAFKALSVSDIHLLYVGSGILEKKLRSWSESFKNIHFMPFQNQRLMPSVYHACDLFCLPSKNDSWGLSVNEAMAAGKAIIASDKTGAAIDLIKLTNGKIFQSDDFIDLKKKLHELLSNREQLKLKGKSSLEIISSWNFENQVKNILDAITQ